MARATWIHARRAARKLFLCNFPVILLPLFPSLPLGSRCSCMKSLAADSPVHRRFAPTALMVGNIVTGCSILAPAGMLIEMSSDLGISVHTAGLLVTFGALVLCIGSPLTAWLTSRIERRTLLTVT